MVHEIILNNLLGPGLINILMTRLLIQSLLFTHFLREINRFCLCIFTVPLTIQRLLALSLFSLLRNLHMSLLTGFRVEKDYKYNESEVLRYIASLESKFSLIMIADHFHESVILLRRLMNWSMKGQYPWAN